MGILTPAIRITFSKREALVRVTLRYFVVKHVFNKIEKLNKDTKWYGELQYFYQKKYYPPPYFLILQSRVCKIGVKSSLTLAVAYCSQQERR